MLPAAPFRLNLGTVDRYLAQSVASGRRATLAYPPATREPSDRLLGFLHNIQGNILQPHGRTYARILLFAFQQAATPAAIRGFLETAAVTLTPALQQYSDSRNLEKNGGMKPFVGFMLTAAGVRAAGRPVPTEASGANSFAAGMRARAGLLGDPVSADGTPLHWEPFYAENPPLHGAWLIAHKSPQGLARLRDQIGTLGQGVATVVREEEAITARDAEGFAREPFGFRDGISMPQYFVGDGREGGLVDPPLEQVLLDSDGPQSCCSFMVFRKLEQHVNRFRAFEAALAPHLEAAGIESQDAGRLVIGRYPDGRPLVQGVGAPHTPGDPRQVRFSFAEDMGARKCPFSAHIRKAFFRQPQVAGGVPPEHQLKAQFVRRGMLFGAEPQWPPQKAPSGPVGLHFMAYMAGIGAQFEKLQMEWFRGEEFPVTGTNLPDPLLLGGESPKGEWAWPERGIKEVPISSFVTPRGGAYFFVPSVSWLLGTAPTF